MRTKLLIGIIMFSFPTVTFSQGASIVNELPDFIPPTPEASSILKADNLTVGYTTGSANINIPLYSLQCGGYSLPISLGYSSTGIKVDEYSSMVGMGWAVNFGGVISRTVFDVPDEMRTSNNCNLNTYNFSNPGWNELNFLKNSTDKQSDVFTFSFPGGSGKFILDLNLQPVQITKQNLKMQVIGGYFLNGFIITTDDGTDYYFQDAEVSTSRNPTGSNCEKTYENYSVKTSWYLTKIVLSSRQKEINFTYSTADITFQSSISQTISKVTYTENYQCAQGAGPTGPACEIGSERFSTCISVQVVTSKFISKIETSDGDKVEFFYDATLRSDLQNGKRLSSLKVTNRGGNRLRNVVFNGVYKYSINGGGAYKDNRLFLETVNIQGAGATTSSQLQYVFYYDDYAGLPGRLTYAQDFYGYYNGKTNNPSLIPVLASGDVNYSTYNNGTGGTLVQFGDRSIDANYSKKGLLIKVVYPTKGYDLITYTANYTEKNSTEILAGGHSVSKISSYTDENVKVLEKEFIYRNKTDNKLSSYRLTENLIFSQLNQVKKDGYRCQQGIQGYTICVGPQCNYAVVTSNATHPITTFGSQHLYFRAVQEKVTGTSSDNGVTEHKYSYFNGGVLHPQPLMGNPVLNTPYQIVPDILIGETETNIFKNTGTQYQLVKNTTRSFTIAELSEFKNYVVKNNYTSWCEAGPGNPPLADEMGAFDVDVYYVNTYTVKLDNIVEKDYTDGGQILTKTTTFEYNNSAYTYPTRIKANESDGIETKTERKYPHDYATAPFTGMVTRNVVSPVIEEKQFKNNVLLTTKSATYVDYFSNGNLYVPSNIDLKIANNTQTQKVQFFEYDLHGNAKDLSKENDQRFSYVWDYKNNYPIAKVNNATNNNIAYTSFESDGSGNWTFTGLKFTDGSAPTGRKAYYLNTGSITKTGLSSGTTFYVTYWSKSGQQNVSGSSSPTLIRTNGSWSCYEHKVVNPAGQSIQVSGSGIIDELRLYPEKSLMTSNTFDPLIGVTSQCGPNNIISYYEYDEFDRLILIRDINKNILKKVCYNYSGQTENNCPVYYNAATGGYYTRNNCQPGYQGSLVYYEIPANTYSSTVSQDDANQKAQNDVAANGQAYANAIGTCTYTPTLSLYYSNYAGQMQYITLTNTSTSQQFFYYVSANSSGYLGDVPEGTYNIQITDGYGWYFNYYEAGCSNFISGYGADFYNIELSSSCNYIQILIPL